MYWLHPPPLRRRILAVVVVLAAIAWDLRSSATEPYPTASAPVAAGTILDGSHVAWIDVPAGAFPHVDPIGAVLAAPLTTGEPITPAVIADGVDAPDGWWTVPLAIGTLAGPGDEVMLVVTDPPLTVIGVVLESQVGDPFDLAHRPAAVAVPPDSTALVAAAARQGLLVTAIRGTAGDR